MRWIVAKIERLVDRVRQGKAAPGRKGDPDIAARFQLAAKFRYNRRRIWHVLDDVIQNHQVVTRIRNRFIAGTVYADRKELVHSCRVEIAELVTLNVRACVMAGWKPFPGERW